MLAGCMVMVAAACCGGRVPGALVDDAGAVAEPALEESGDQAAQPSDAVRRRMTLIFAGDISFGRETGQVLLRKPHYDFFSAIEPWLQSAEVRVANLESQLTDRNGETQSPELELVFAGPPSGADALSRAGFDVVSLANNHAWDYGKKGFLETLEHLERVGVAYVGAGRDRKQAYAPVMVERAGVRVALLAVTDIWNQGALRTHKGAEHVAGPDRATLVATVQALRADEAVDAIVVQHHGGCEFVERPLQRTRELARAAIDAGADAVIGHHPHVVQGIEWYRDRPIVYSLGNLMMRLREGRPREGTGMLARLQVGEGKTPVLWACPYRIDDLRMRPFAMLKNGKGQERGFYAHLEKISASWGGISLWEQEVDGCRRVSEGAQGPVAPAQPGLMASR
jgi:poly-gamma-glutamate synthesis protein (capsule biosynthesis protein)